MPCGAEGVFSDAGRAGMRPTVFLIAYHFPPDNAIGGARPFRFYKYLKRLGYECQVFTAVAPEAGKESASDIHYVPDPLKVRPMQGLAWQAERVSWKFLLRGMHVLGWSEAVFKAGSEWMAQHKGEHVMLLSSSPPFGTHLAAWRLARKFRQRWIADFRDPIYSPGAERALLENIIAPRLERKILRTANAVLANTDAMRNSWVARTRGLKDKIHVLWNGFDPEDVIEPSPVLPRDYKILSHLGELYGGRDIRPILHSMERLRGSGRIPAHVKLLQVGVAERECLPDDDFLEKATQQGWLELRDPILSREARKLALDSDGLLLIQPQSAVQVPGKLFEYLRLGRPILAYVVRDSPVERILQQAGVPYQCFYPESKPQEIDQSVEAVLGLPNSRPYLPNDWFTNTFEASRQAVTLDRIIQSTL